MCCLLLDVYNAFDAVYCIRCTVGCMCSTMYRIFHIAHCILHTVHCVLYFVCRILCIAHGIQQSRSIQYIAYRFDPWQEVTLSYILRHRDGRGGQEGWSTQPAKGPPVLTTLSVAYPVEVGFHSLFEPSSAGTIKISISKAGMLT